MYNKKVKYHKKIRLDREIYTIPNLPCFITICTKDKRPLFRNTVLAKEILQLIREISLSNEIPIYAYCIMCDHVHLLSSASEKQGIIEFVTELKSLSTKLAWKHSFRGTIWQRSFYDHFLRRDEDVYVTAMYILNNPVRKGLVNEWKEYKLCGSFVYEL